MCLQLAGMMDVVSKATDPQAVCCVDAGYWRDWLDAGK